MAKLLLAGALMRVVWVFLAEMQLAGAHHCVMVLRAVAQKHREEAFGKRVHGRQGNARWERRCTTDKHRRARGTAGT